MALLITQYRATMLRYLGVLIYEMKEVNNYNAGFENGLQVEFCKAQERCNISVCILKCHMGNWRIWRTTGHNLWVLWILWLYPRYNEILWKTSKLFPARIMQSNLLMFGCVNVQIVCPMSLNFRCNHSHFLYHMYYMIKIPNKFLFKTITDKWLRYLNVHWIYIEFIFGIWCKDFLTLHKIIVYYPVNLCMIRSLVVVQVPFSMYDCHKINKWNHEYLNSTVDSSWRTACRFHYNPCKAAPCMYKPL